MDNKKRAEQLRIAAEILETGAEWQYFDGYDDRWRMGSSSYDPVDAIVVDDYEIRIKPFATLRNLPKNDEYHRLTDFREGELPEGVRPLLKNEVIQEGDECVYRPDDINYGPTWGRCEHTLGLVPNCVTQIEGINPCYEFLFRTKRPLPQFTDSSDEELQKAIDIHTNNSKQQFESLPPNVQEKALRHINGEKKMTPEEIDEIGPEDPLVDIEIDLDDFSLNNLQYIVKYSCEHNMSVSEIFKRAIEKIVEESKL